MMSVGVNKCPGCNGKKQVVGLGCMLKNCTECGGSGLAKTAAVKAPPGRPKKETKGG